MAIAFPLQDGSFLIIPTWTPRSIVSRGHPPIHGGAADAERGCHIAMAAQFDIAADDVEERFARMLAAGTHNVPR